MIAVLLAFAAPIAAMIAPAPMVAVPEPPSPAPVAPPPAEGDAPLTRSAASARVADWFAASNDNGGLPYIIVDKASASLAMFDARGKAIGDVPVLVGIAPGDDATPGIGTKNLSRIGPAEKTTPAGRFRARYGLAAGRQKILWVDYATSVAIHPIPPKSEKSEQRRARMLSPSPDDNRITFGCINVASAFYRKSVRPLFQKKGGYVYVLPDIRPIEEVFPRLRVQALIDRTAP